MKTISCHRLIKKLYAHSPIKTKTFVLTYVTVLLVQYNNIENNQILQYSFLKKPLPA